uniref:Uncharacterized protein n=1 Tax=Oncorhynchus tshawytscha TaxID=74940 RepID=A0A8C8EHP0_ONCTS
MAAAYRVVVSSVSCYSSVVVDRRAQSHAVHYCSGSCGALSQGLDCTVVHRSTCSELLTAPSHTHVHTHVYGSSASLKDITGEAINLASGKLKEFSFEKLRLSTSHVTFRKGRKVRPDSYSRRSTDLDIVYGHFTGNPIQCLQGRGRAGLNTVASLYLSSLADESLIARLLEKTRAGEEGGVGGAGGEDIRACLDILVKCSEDLKKCTDIIKQCISRKSPGGGEDGGASPESIYRAVMTRLSSYLRKLPLELEGAGLGELAELVSSLHMLQQAAVPFSPIFGNDQPPRYEDVVQNPPLPKSRDILPPSSLAPDSSLSLSTTPVTAGRHKVQTNGLQHTHTLSHTHSPSPHTHTLSISTPPSQSMGRERDRTQTQIDPQAQRPVPVRHLTANAQATRSTPSSPAPLLQAEGSVEGLGDEEDRALLLRILESIESFAQELVDSGGSPGNTGKTGAQSKEKEVMRLLQDTLATAAKTDTLTQAKLPGSPPAGQGDCPSIPIDVLLVGYVYMC